MAKKEPKKDFRDEYSDYEEIPTSQEFIGLIPILGKLIQKVFSVIVLCLHFLKPLIVVLFIFIVGYLAVTYTPTMWKEIERKVEKEKWNESPEVLKGKDYLLTTEWGICYQQIAPTKERKTCLRTDVGFFEYGLSWKAYFERDKKGKVNISLRAYEGTFGGDFLGAKYHILFHHDLQANGRRVMEANGRVKPFSCKNGAWNFVPGSEHRKEISYLKVDPKIIFYGRGCPRLYITFFKI